MPRFMLLRNDEPKAFDEASPEDIRKILEKYRAWKDRIVTADRLVSSDKLKEEGGKLLSSREGKVTVVDGPYTETKEVVAGYFTIRASSYEEAVELARDCPHLQYGSIVIREVDPLGCGDD
ncbi:YciI family protein [Singulisphaera sp. PoT]|uniref:YciI family protein n=1 Tax=Singulisphaera sp. PoT TaxID=3411797 RepID=UPI003BF5A539